MTAEFEAETIRRGYKRVYLHARQYAVDFYEKLGYSTFGEPFDEVSIPHRHMQKFLVTDQ
jgi:predicted GNAT family N-acyltransferase